MKHGLYIDGEKTDCHSVFSASTTAPMTINPPVLLKDGQTAEVWAHDVRVARFVRDPDTGLSVDPLELL